MCWVSRDASKNINGVFGARQPGYAEEELADDNPEVIAFLNPLPVPPTPTNEQTVIYEHENRIRALEGQPPLTLVDFIAKALSPET